MEIKQENAIEASEAKKKTKRKKKRTATKPDSFQELEGLAMDILEQQGTPYYEWLHRNHQEIVTSFVLTNKEEITELTKEGNKP